MVFEIVSSIPRDLDYNFSNPEIFIREVTLAFVKHMPQIKFMFSGTPGMLRNSFHRSSNIGFLSGVEVVIDEYNNKYKI